MKRNPYIFVLSLLTASMCLVFADVTRGESNTGSQRLLGDYPSPDAMYAEISALAAAYPGIIEAIQYGKSVEGRPLMVLHIARRDGKKRPEALVAGNIHGNEYIGNRLAMAVARKLADGDGKDQWITSLLDRIDFWVIPCINPDGYSRTWADKGNGKWKVMRKNAHGVDLNRNFPRYGRRWIPMAWAGSKRPDNTYYRGTETYSEPETSAIRDFAAQHHFFAAIDFHSFGGYIIPAKCDSHECVEEYKKLAATYRSKQPHKQYTRIQLRVVDQYTGEMEDMLYNEHGAMAVCIELSTAKGNKGYYNTKGGNNHIPFWKNNPKNIDYWIENDRDAALAWIEEAFIIASASSRLY